MFPVFKPRVRYTALDDDEAGPELKDGSAEPSPRPFILFRTGIFSRFTVSLLFATSIVFTLILFSVTLSQLHQATSHTSETSSSSVMPVWECKQPAVRREWRTLAPQEQLNYVDAVKCLATRPSKLRNNGSLYDDFPEVHKRLAQETHQTQNFTPYHRHYLKLYERSLQEECDYKDTLPYWDWSQDWDSFSSAPVWDNVTGFGGNGNAHGTKGVGDGYCVTDGPFSTIQVMFYDGDVQPHCLSRNFADAKQLKELGELVHPDAISKMMQENDYATFEHELEHRAHTFLSRSVGGDLSRFTGPNDPIFFLHHVNIDRIWAQWQQSDPAHRLYAFNGPSIKDPKKMALLTDIMDMGGLGRNIPVQDIMETQSGYLCYTY